MKVNDAKSQVIELLRSQLGNLQFNQLISPISPDPRDNGKFTLLGQAARAIHRFDGWHIPINPDWFDGIRNHPKVKQGDFYWYAIAIPKLSGYTRPHYLICDYLKMREWVLDFKSSQGIDYSNKRYWRADIELHQESRSEGAAYFRWGDEPHGVQDNASRLALLDNISEVMTLYSRQEPARRIISEVSRPVRDTALVVRLKRLYENKCQVCGSVIGAPGNTYSEAHHMKPLGEPHGGPDIESNVLILCPNHHVEFDMGFIAVQPESMKIVHANSKNAFNGCSLTIAPKHKLGRGFILYHYNEVFKLNAERKIYGNRASV